MSWQIKLFSDIFHTASNVCIWLGPSAGDSRYAMDFVKNILGVKYFDNIAGIGRRLESSLQGTGFKEDGYVDTVRK